MKKLGSVLLALAMVMALLAGCGDNGAASGGSGSAGGSGAVSGSGSTGGSDTFSGSISVISREDGSGTRGAFIELLGVEQKDADGNKVDMTTDQAEITNSTAVMLTTVSGNEYAIGYVSMASLNKDVKALRIDGAEATVENVKDGSYKVARPFNIATKGDVSEVAQDFINFIMSEDGQKVVENEGCISQGNNGAFTSTQPSGNISVAGSSSVSPLMEKLKEAYAAVNPNATIELQTSDSTTGMTSAAEGLCDIGMASRELKDSETGAGLTATVIAMDGIAVVVNNENPIDGLTSEQVCSIFTGETTDWSEVA
ncbi:substrate-binding domain-containing protein [Oscillibacter sp. MSJ-2]|uniref:Substrate-binding domain-containing protein n=1 Tax=Dysosmobacter acutus TaxID=2841504 RepID=A0ABS6FEW5_9FIRM|nr:substrate-binding domain-containing protein [Dysosmobacter acutus]MBU5627910.1 substrate-binding domain-containing protein [Dysosmobacter acutus]